MENTLNNDLNGNFAKPVLGAVLSLFDGMNPAFRLVFVVDIFLKKIDQHKNCLNVDIVVMPI